ncbi:DUF1465 family protein [Pacificimonas flava]|uniref:DUF1465 family protein n=1 Tax=Pacificimonas flava TaxID=1234595 RepID=M2U650_9SPHN|nr:DUF1465 family protein [Pacificimonas flava]EMD83497.1 hypothetical protein C725_1398 [Pacificimonas flava]MBB5278949.1 regulator of CtrA degradation [Pacificimonas flava]
MARRSNEDETRLTEKVVEALYLEAMTLADDARSYFDEEGKTDREALGPIERVQFSCESLRVTTRLMHSVSWLLNRKAVAAGELTTQQGLEPERRLGRAGEAVADPSVVAALPPRARHVIEASRDLYERVKRLDETLVVEEVPLSPARQLFGKLETHF